MSAQKMRLGKYIKFKGGIYQQVAADTSFPLTVPNPWPENTEAIEQDTASSVDDTIFSVLKGFKDLGSVAGRRAAEELLDLHFKVSPDYAPDDADAYVGENKHSRWQAFVDEEDTITFEHENGKRYVFTTQR